MGRLLPVKSVSPVQNLESMVDVVPLLLREVTGGFAFTENGIDVDDLLVRVGAGDASRPDETNAFKIRGHLSGYRPESPVRLQVDSADPQGLYFPARPTFLASLPREVKDFYEGLNPEGTCRVRAEVNRTAPGAVPQITGVLELLDARFKPRQFPYQIRGVGGKIGFGRDPFSGKDFISVMNVHASGMAGGPNEKLEVAVSGRIGPLGPDIAEPGIELRARGTNLSSEAALTRAMPPEVKAAFKIFDAPGKGDLPEFRGDFAGTIVRQPGPGQRVVLNLDLDLTDGIGELREFPYNAHVSGKMTIHTDWMELKDVTASKGTGAARITGYVRWIRR
jgi:hypothetical protein